MLNIFTLILLILFACKKQDSINSEKNVLSDSVKTKETLNLSENQRKVLAGAKKTLRDGAEYDMSMAYYSIGFPNGDIDNSIGVCTDVVVRALRLGEVCDLQSELNKDIKKNFSDYPMKRWGAKKADSNIDHRRVMNLEVWFAKNWETIEDNENVMPGDIIVWDMNQDGYSDHIGIVSDNKLNGRYTVIHNHPDPGYIADEDKIYKWEITGHYRIK